jgi:hypothetical protein
MADDLINHIDDLMNHIDIDGDQESPASVSKPPGEKKRLKKLEKMMETGLFSPWERYRALVIEMDHQTDLVEMADRKSRFALVILATLNAVNFMAVIRPDLLSGGAVPSGAVVPVYLTFYVGLSLYLCTQAISTLRPRLFSSVQKMLGDNPGVDPSRQVLSIHVMTTQTLSDYYELWQKAPFAQVNREVAMRVQVTARIITLKYRALEKLYSGLLVLIALTGFMIVGLTYLRLTI